MKYSKVTQIDRNLKKTGGYNDRNSVMVTTKMRTWILIFYIESLLVEEMKAVLYVAMMFSV